MDVEEQKFLIEEKQQDVDYSGESIRRDFTPNKARNWVTTCAVLYGIVTTVLLVKGYFWNSGLPVPYSPINHLIEPVLQDVYPDGHSVFSKEPSEELDTAWAELVHPMLIKSSKSEVESNNENPEERLELVEGGYLGSLGVFHELHCLRRLYWHMYDDRYFLNYTEADKEYERAHARHCIEALRLSLMCQANTALYTFEWDDNNAHKPQVLTSKAKRQCVKWDPVHKWAMSRTVGLDPKFYRPGTKLSQ